MNKFKKIALTVGTSASALALSAQNAFAAIEAAQVTPGKGFATDIGAMLNGLISFIMVIAALLVFLYLIWGGIEWITSGGDKGKTENARNKITAAVIGLIVVAASYAVLTLALNFLGFTGGIDQVFESAKNIQGN
jgi:hypothetical protein